MINLYYLGQVYIVCGRTDMRRGIDGLAAIVKDEFDLDPFSGRVFIFCGGKATVTHNQKIKYAGKLTETSRELYYYVGSGAYVKAKDVS